jgi:hypothetical protein
VDENGPVPWYTYPMIEFLPAVLRPEFRVFEYGSGASSIWWSGRVGGVVSVEHDVQWYRQVEKSIPKRNHTLVLREPNSMANTRHDPALEPFFRLRLIEQTTGDVARDVRRGLVWRPFRSYVTEILNYEPFDVIIIDGMARVPTAWIAQDRLKPGGLIIFDNSDREGYADAYRFLVEGGFARIDFWGPGPLNPYGWCTSLFTRSLDLFRALPLESVAAPAPPRFPSS